MFKKMRATWRKVRLIWRLTTIGITLLTLYTVIGFLVLPWGARHLAQSQLTQTLGRTVTIERVRFNPYSLEAAVENLRVAEKDSGSPFVSLARLYVNLSGSSLFSLAAVADTVLLESPMVHVVRTQPNVYNFTDILETLAAKPQEDGQEDADEEDEEPVDDDVMPLVVRNFAITNGTAWFDDKPLSGSHLVEKLNLSVPFTSGLKEDLETFVEPNLELVVDGRPVDLKGKTLPFHDSLKTEFVLDVRALDLARYWEYVPVKMDARLASGQFSCDLTLSLERGPGVLPKVDVRGSASLENVAMTGPDGKKFAGFASLAVPLQGFHLLDRTVALGEVVLTEPFARVRRGGDGNLDVLAWLPGADNNAVPEAAADVQEPEQDEQEDKADLEEQAEPGQQAEPEKTFLITVERARVDRLAVDFADALQPEPFVGSYVIDAHADTIRSDLSAPIPFSVTVAGSEDEKISASGSFDAAAMAGSGACEISGVRAARYRPYYASSVPYAVRSGVLDLKGEWTFDSSGSGPRVQFTGGLGVADALLGDPATGHKALGLKTLRLGGVDVDTMPLAASVKSVDLSAVAYHDPATGRVLASLNKVAVGNVSFKGEGTAASAASIKFDTLEYHDPASGNRLATLRKGTAGGLAFHGKQNTAAVKTVDLSGLLVRDPKKFKEFSSLSELRLRSAEAKLDPLAVSLAQVAFKGAALEDSGAQQRLASLGELALHGVKLLDNGDITVGQVRVDKPQADFVTDSQGIMNLSRVLAPFTDVEPVPANATVAEGADGEEHNAGEEQPTSAEAESVPAPASDTNTASTPSRTVAVEHVELTGGRVAFRDETLSPAYATQVDGFRAKLANFSTVPGSKAAFGLNATIDGHAPLRVGGTVAATNSSINTDLKLSVRNLSMPSLSPYTRKFIAYPLATGKFNGSVRLHLQGASLDADNVFLIEQLTLGEKVDSPDAPSLPIELGLALLSDRDGNIELDIPVQGRLDDPQFRLGKVIFGAIVNLFTKIVTAPFAILGSLFEGGEETGFLEFDPGLSSLTGDSVKKLESVASALEKRPRLRVELAGYVHADKDRPALENLAFDNMIGRRKLLRMQEEGEAGKNVSVTVSAEEYPELLLEVYEEAEFERPRNFLGILLDQPVEEMERMIREHIEITNADLLALARARAAAAQDHLLSVGMVEPERVFLRDVALDAPESHTDLAASRVELLLK